MGIVEIRREYGLMADEVFEKIKSGIYSEPFGRQLIREIVISRDEEINSLWKKPRLTVENKRWMFLAKRDIFPNGRRYLTRYILVQTPLFGIYVHKFMDSDEDRALHDHPWNFVSWIIKGRYLEHTDDNTIRRDRWSFAYRPASHRHRVELIDRENVGTYMDGTNDLYTFNFKPVWTVVVVSKRVRAWGFWVSVIHNFKNFPLLTGKMWCHWKNYNLENGLCENEPLINEGEN